ncbi:hypothetical protein SDC9_137265 [bioreactor metagenome]|uniref:Uncharacterized protein n=1 Tax=bioreactor metagenome TaxID=1076179 RepID=A0A645DM42_9ZZZZ
MISILIRRNTAIINNFISLTIINISKVTWCIGGSRRICKRLRIGTPYRSVSICIPTCGIHQVIAYTAVCLRISPKINIIFLSIIIPCISTISPFCRIPIIGSTSQSINMSWTSNGNRSTLPCWVFGNRSRSCADIGINCIFCKVRAVEKCIILEHCFFINIACYRQAVIKPCRCISVSHLQCKRKAENLGI